MTRGFNLPAKHVIHAAVPTYDLNDPERCQVLLHSACAESLKLARKHYCKSIAFPLISHKIYGYPQDKALEVARHAIEEFLSEHDMDVHKNFKKVAGYPEARFHDLRHSFAVASLQNGDDIKTAQENLGHHTAAFPLDVYGHVTKKMRRDSANRMQHFITSVRKDEPKE